MFFTSLHQVDPVSAIQEFGPYVGAVILCTGLFIWNAIQLNSVSRDIDVNTRAIAESNTELKSHLEGQVQAQRELAQSVHQLAEAIHHQAEVSSEELGLVREMATKQDVLMANQTTIMTNFQRVVEQLIDIVKKG
jgi:methyl-accepting chemotaxis protein